MTESTTFLKHVRKKLNLPLSKTAHSLLGINGVSSEICLHSTGFKFSLYFIDDYKYSYASVMNKALKLLKFILYW